MGKLKLAGGEIDISKGSFEQALFLSGPCRARPLFIKELPLEQQEIVNRWLRETSDLHFETAMCWLAVKKYGKPYRLKGKQATIEATKPFGEYLFCILELCIQCFHRIPDSEAKASYEDAFGWFFRIVMEMKILISAVACERVQSHFEGKPETIHKRGELTKLAVAENSLLRQGIPIDCPEEANLALLHEIACRMLNFKEFEKQYWRPYLKSRTAWLRNTDRNPEFVRPRLKDGRLIQEHRGRN